MNRILISTIVLSITIIHPAGAARTPPSARRVLTLRPVPAQGPTIEFNYSYGNTLPPFEKEPALKGKETARGLILTVPPTPLCNAIVVTRDRNLLHLKYRLTGIGGELYEYEGEGFANPPLFRVYKGPMKVASSAFGGG